MGIDSILLAATTAIASFLQNCFLQMVVPVNVCKYKMCNNHLEKLQFNKITYGETHYASDAP